MIGEYIKCESGYFKRDMAYMKYYINNLIYKICSVNKEITILNLDAEENDKHKPERESEELEEDQNKLAQSSESERNIDENQISDVKQITDIKILSITHITHIKTTKTKITKIYKYCNA